MLLNMRYGLNLPQFYILTEVDKLIYLTIRAFGDLGSISIDTYQTGKRNNSNQKLKTGILYTNNYYPTILSDTVTVSQWYNK